MAEASLKFIARQIKVIQQQLRAVLDHAAAQNRRLDRIDEKLRTPAEPRRLYELEARRLYELEARLDELEARLDELEDSPKRVPIHVSES